jgi:hypothetical protein
VEISLRDVDGVGPGVFEKDDIGIVLDVRDDGKRDEEDEEATDEENEDTNVKNAARIEEGRRLVGRFGSMENVIVIHAVHVVIY